MSTEALGRLRRGLLLCVLALGVLGMHQLATPDPMPGMGTPVLSSPPAMVMDAVAVTAATLTDGLEPRVQGVAHDRMHPCLAVLGAVGLLLLAFWLIRRGFAAASPSGRAVARAPDRPPKAGGRSLLASVCVFRL